MSVGIYNIIKSSHGAFWKPVTHPVDRGTGTSGAAFGQRVRPCVSASLPLEGSRGGAGEANWAFHEPSPGCSSLDDGRYSHRTDIRLEEKLPIVIMCVRPVPLRKRMRTEG